MRLRDISTLSTVDIGHFHCASIFSGSDSLVYDYEGRFQPVKFEEMFTKFDKGAAWTLDVFLWMRRQTMDWAMDPMRHTRMHVGIILMD